MAYQRHTAHDPAFVMPPAPPRAAACSHTRPPQVGLGRTGKLWGHQHHGVEPDMMTLAKPLAGGRALLLLAAAAAAILAT